MKPAPFAYARPQTLDEAVGLLAGSADAKVLAGGQSLVPLLSMRLASPAMLVDINALADLAHVTSSTRRRPDRRAGPAHRRARGRRGACASSRCWRWRCPGSPTPTIRNRGTTVGSLAHADAAAEMPVVLALLGGSLDVVGAGRPAHDPGAVRCSPDRWSRPLAHDEIAVEAFFPALAPGSGVGFDEVARRHGDYALCGVAAWSRWTATG